MGLCVLCEITIPRIAIKKNPQLTQQTVNRLKEAFWKLYETKPIEKISVRQITELAGYNHATFYLYFSSVRDVRDQIEDDLIAQRDLILKQCMHDGTLEIGQVISSLATMLMPYGHVLLGPERGPGVHRARRGNRLAIPATNSVPQHRTAYANAIAIGSSAAASGITASPVARSTHSWRRGKQVAPPSTRIRRASTESRGRRNAGRGR